MSITSTKSGDVISVKGTFTRILKLSNSTFIEDTDWLLHKGQQSGKNGKEASSTLVAVAMPASTGRRGTIMKIKQLPNLLP